MSAKEAARWLSWFLAGMSGVWILILVFYLSTGESTVGAVLLVELVVIVAGGLAYWRLRTVSRRRRG
ncbi:MAG TPA: hypothetical protein VG329_00920 [Candidatus Dormibacteraeota bacterium]|nr:hypothetical protein [Candidatus Dormibacteraeota bacterium]